MNKPDHDEETHYGGTLTDLHPYRTEVINEAMVRFETDEQTHADLVLLWFDVVYNVVLCRAGEAAAEVARTRSELADMTTAFSRARQASIFSEAEVELLRANQKEWMARTHYDEMVKVQAEVKRLKAGLERISLGIHKRSKRNREEDRLRHGYKADWQIAREILGD